MGFKVVWNPQTEYSLTVYGQAAEPAGQDISGMDIINLTRAVSWWESKLRYLSTKFLLVLLKLDWEFGSLGRKPTCFVTLCSVLLCLVIFRPGPGGVLYQHVTERSPLFQF